MTGASVPFGDLVILLEWLSKRDKYDDKVTELRAFFAAWTRDVGLDTFPVVRLLLPHLDRRIYRMKEAMLALALARALELPRTQAAALENWTTPGQSAAAGDFSLVAHDFIYARSTVRQGSLSIDDVNALLDELARIVPSRGALDQRAQLFKKVTKTMTPNEIKWLIRIILGDLRVGVLERTVLPSLHPDALEVWQASNSLRKACAVTLGVTTPATIAAAKRVTPGEPFHPMLAARNTRDLSSVVASMQKERDPSPAPDPVNPFFCDRKEFFVEEKFDGARRLMHKMGDEYRYFSRNAKNYSTSLGRDRLSGILTPHLEGVFVDELEEVVLDGEILLYDSELDMRVACRDNDDFEDLGAMPSRRICYKVFDILHVKTKAGGVTSCLDLPLYKRKQLLHSVVNREKPGVLELVEVRKVSTAVDLRDALSQILEDRGEGLVCKHPLSSYLLGEGGRSWIKLKPDYVDELGETLVGLVVGALWGRGKKGGTYAAFLVALRGTRADPDCKSEVETPVFSSFVKVASGLKASDHAWIQTADKWRTYGRRELPWLRVGKNVPDMYIVPSDSFLVEVKGARVQSSNDYDTGLSVLFPRVKSIVREGDWQRADTVRDLLTVAKEGLPRAAGETDRVVSARPSTVIPARPAAAEDFDAQSGLEIEPGTQSDGDTTLPTPPPHTLAPAASSIDVPPPEAPISSRDLERKDDDQRMRALTPPTSHLVPAKRVEQDAAALTAAPDTDSRAPEATPARASPLGPPLLIYFDTLANASANGLPPFALPSAKAQKTDLETVRESRYFAAAGGQRCTDLNDPNLTHVVTHRMNRLRLDALKEKTRSPDCLFVTTDWVIASVEANYPVLEDEFELERLQRRS